MNLHVVTNGNYMVPVEAKTLIDPNNAIEEEINRLRSSLEVYETKARMLSSTGMAAALSIIGIQLGVDVDVYQRRVGSHAVLTHGVGSIGVSETTFLNSDYGYVYAVADVRNLRRESRYNIEYLRLDTNRSDPNDGYFIDIFIYPKRLGYAIDSPYAGECGYLILTPSPTPGVMDTVPEYVDSQRNAITTLGIPKRRG